MQRSCLEAAKHCLATAEQDYAVALRLADDMPNVASFHAQQAAEKAMRAALVARCGYSARDYSIVALLTECTISGLSTSEDLIDDAGRLPSLAPEQDMYPPLPRSNAYCSELFDTSSQRNINVRISFTEGEA